MPLSRQRESFLSDIRQGNIRRVQRLLMEKAIDPNFPSSAPTTPLHEAVRNDDFPMVKALVKGGANVTHMSSNGKTCLDLARNIFASPDIIRYLEQEKAKVFKGRLGPRPGPKKATKPLDHAFNDRASAAPVFNEESLPKIFNPKKWIGRLEEMREMWDRVPLRLQDEFDFVALHAEARRRTLKSCRQKRPVLKPRPKT